MLEQVAGFVLLAALVYAALSDLTSYEIPNWLSVVIVADFVAAALAGTIALADIGWHLSAGLAVLAVGVVVFARGIMGGGDAKLLASCAVWSGWSGLPRLFLAVAIAGGLFALLILGLRRLKLPAAWTERAWIRRLHSPERGIPYGVAIAIGGVLVFSDLPLADAAPGFGAAPWREALLFAALA